jgi:carbamoyl-phosphate synthase large subunit
MREAVKVSNDSPVLLDRFLNDAIEVDVDALCDGRTCVIGGIMEHIEQAGVHSGDSACSLPPFSLSAGIVRSCASRPSRWRRSSNVVGLMNVQFAIQFDERQARVRARGEPARVAHGAYVSKATGRPLAKIAARCMVGQSLAQQGCARARSCRRITR